MGLGILLQQLHCYLFQLCPQHNTRSSFIHSRRFALCCQCWIQEELQEPPLYSHRQTPLRVDAGIVYNITSYDEK